MRGALTISFLVAISGSIASAQPLVTARVYEVDSGPTLAVELERGMGEALNADGRVAYRPYVDILVPRDQAVKNIAQAETLIASADKAWDDLNVPVCKELLEQAYTILSRELTTLVEQPEGLKPVHDTLLRLARTTFLDGDQPAAREYLRQLYALRGSLAKDLFPAAMKKLVTEARLLYETLGTGRASLESDPAGAEVYFDGVRQTGVTPLELGDIIPGPHVVTFVRRGYEPTTTTIDVRGSNEKTPLFFTLERYPKNPLAPLDRARQKLGTDPPPLADLHEGATSFNVDALILVRLIQRDKEGGGTVPVLMGFVYDRRADKVVAKIEREGTEAELVAMARSLARDLIGELSSDGKYDTPKPGKKAKKPKPLVAKSSGAKPNLNLTAAPTASDGQPVWYKRPLVWYIGGGVGGAIVVGAIIGISIGAAQHQRHERQLANDIAILGGGGN